MKLRFTFVFVTGISGLVIACGGSAIGTMGGGSASTSQSFIDDFCALTGPCCSRVNRPTDGASCRALYGSLLTTQTYDATKGTACLSEMRARSSTSEFCDDPTGGTTSCSGVFKNGGTGTAQPGANCTNDGDCAASGEGDVNCASSFSGNATTKSCQIEIDGKEGDMPCIKTRDGSTTSYSFSSTSGDGGAVRPPARGYICDVAKGVYCNSKTSACTKVQGVGGACESTFDSYACVKTAYCDPQQRACAARKGIGEACSASSQSCVAKATCDSATKQCAVGLPTGAACGADTACESQSCTNGTCAAKGGNDLSTALLCGGN